jgi:sporulation protein YlmC with PRC-barrel domain
LRDAFADRQHKVEGAAVYRSNGEKIGQIQRVMIGKQSGKSAMPL